MTHTILMADNERGIRLYCKQELEADGYHVLLAADGEDAVSVLSETPVPVDLVVLDEHMPRCGGLDAARSIRQSHPDLPLVLFTADQDYDRHYIPTVDACVMKSADLSQLKTVIDELLGGPRPASRFARRVSLV
jgi:CheY-like chemotaxis protein